MTGATVSSLITRFNELSQRLPDAGAEFCNIKGYDESDHCRGVTNMIEVDKGATPRG
jgi:hypothetical protein